ncbi:hypothetical protein Plhal304r1_c046g0127361 [Plasmopara halstedii]
MFIDDQAERVNHIESDDNHPLFWGMAKTFCGLVAKVLRNTAFAPQRPAGVINNLFVSTTFDSLKT